MFAPGQEGRKRHEATGIWSPDGEWLPLLAPVVTEGRPESWLGRVEEAMFATTRRHLLKVLEDSKSEKHEPRYLLGCSCRAGCIAAVLPTSLGMCPRQGAAVHVTSWVSGAA
jgi:hypothetical protein